MVSAEETAGFACILMPRGEDIPEAEGLITCPSDDSGSIWTHGEVEYSVGVSGEGGHLIHIGVLPNIDLIVGVPVGRDDLIESLTEHQVAHL